MKCEFCFATFEDMPAGFLPKGHLGLEDAMAVVEALAQAGFRKVNFAGGEPTLCPWLIDLIERAKDLGLTTSVVTNGSRISEAWASSVSECLDWAALSVDSMNPETLLKVGRAASSGPMSPSEYLRAIGVLKQHNIRAKVNTVVTKANLEEDLTDFIIKARPERWKILQVLPVSGQNDGTVDGHLISGQEFDRYIRESRRVEGYGITLVPENNDLMTGSYVMVDPAGRFFDNVAGTHTYSRPILEAGVIEAFRDVSVDADKFLARSGLYAW